LGFFGVGGGIESSPVDSRTHHFNLPGRT